MSHASKFGESLKNGLATAAKVGAAAVATVTAAATAMTATFVKGTSEVAQYGDNIDKVSQKMGLSAEAYQEWDFIMQHSGTSIESLQASMKTLANAVDSGNDAFERLGISQSEIAEMNQEELFAKTIEQLQKVKDTTERTYLAGQLLGRGATELGALLNTSAEDTEKMRQQVHELGGVMSNEAVKAAAAYQDSLQNMQTAFAGVQRGMLSEFLPSMVTVMDGLALIFSGNDSGIAKITEGVNQFSNKLMEAVPKIFELGQGILSSLATAILNNLPTLTTTATKVILQLFKGIVSSLPQIAKGALEIVKSLTQGLSSNLPTIMNSAIELINILANGILEMLPEIVKLGIDIVGAIGQGLLDNADSLLNSTLDLVTKLADFIIQGLPKIQEAAVQITLTLGEKLAEAAPQLITSVTDVIIKLVDMLTDPKQLNKMLDVGLTLISTVGQALVDNVGKITEKIPEIVQNLVDFFLNPEQIGKVIDMGVSFLTSLISNTAEIISVIVNQIPVIIDGIVSAFTSGDNLEKIIAAGVDLFVSIISNTGEIIRLIAEKIPEITGSIVTAFTEVDWLQIGKDIMNGIIDGMIEVMKLAGDLPAMLSNWITGAEYGNVGYRMTSEDFQKQMEWNNATWQEKANAAYQANNSTVINQNNYFTGDSTIMGQKKALEEMMAAIQAQ